ncbi:hypothetical protein Q2440_26190, partial [Escherichia coli]|nr:hypothetical protein [Escherichia coli]
RHAVELPFETSCVVVMFTLCVCNYESPYSVFISLRLTIPKKAEMASVSARIVVSASECTCFMTG